MTQILICQLDRLDIKPHVPTARQEISLPTATPAPKTKPKTQPHDATPQSDRPGSASNPIITTHRSRATPHPSQLAPTDSRTTRRFSALWQAIMHISHQDAVLALHPYHRAGLPSSDEASRTQSVIHAPMSTYLTVVHGTRAPRCSVLRIRRRVLLGPLARAEKASRGPSFPMHVRSVSSNWGFQARGRARVFAGAWRCGVGRLNREDGLVGSCYARLTLLCCGSDLGY
jgi:hypothetical protein